MHGARFRHRAGAQIDAAGGEILHRGRGAVRGHPGDVVGGKAHGLQPADQREMPDAALAGAGGFQLADGRSLDGVGELLHGLVGRGRIDLDAGRVLVHQRERRVARRLEVGQPLPVHHGDFDRDHADVVAVGLRGRDRRMADHARAAGAVDHVERLAEVLFEQCRDDARGRIGTAAGAPRHHHGDRARRIGLREGGLGEPDAGGRCSGGRERAAGELCCHGRVSRGGREGRPCC